MSKKQISDEIEKLKKENQNLREALMFYANPENYGDNGEIFCGHTIAADTLKNLKQKKPKNNFTIKLYPKLLKYFHDFSARRIK